MKTNKQIVSCVLSLIILINVLLFSSIQTFAHNKILEVVYDDCEDQTNSDYIDEKWYVLNQEDESYHISHNETTIMYYFVDQNTESNYVWPSHLSTTQIEEIKDAYANSMKKWNNVYFYSLDDTGVVTKHKVINIVEGNATNHNLKIYLTTGISHIATTNYDLEGGMEEVFDETSYHEHYKKWRMAVNADYFYMPNGTTNLLFEAKAAVIKERTGAHEIGHILGLCDIDLWCGSNSEDDHHRELLMGYGEPIISRSYNIKYKDIAGVAITRGFHTDDDHKWLYMGQQEDGRHKLVCSICNGVKYESSLSGFTYNYYNECNQNHELSSGNMMAVASYGTTDYYKCKYCRYVAPFSSNVEQNYTKESYSETMHIYTNNVEGLNYSFLEEHSFEFVNLEGEGKHERSCDCGYRIIENHYEAVYVKKDIIHHHSYCMCGFDFLLHPHNFVFAGVNISRCRDCGFTQNVTGPGIIIKGTEDEPVTE